MGGLGLGDKESSSLIMGAVNAPRSTCSCSPAPVEKGTDLDGGDCSGRGAASYTRSDARIAGLIC